MIKVGQTGWTKTHADRLLQRWLDDVSQHPDQVYGAYDVMRMATAVGSSRNPPLTLK